MSEPEAITIRRHFWAAVAVSIIAATVMLMLLAAALDQIAASGPF